MMYLCRYKEQTHGVELKEDEVDEKEIREMFPQFDQVQNYFFSISPFVVIF